MGVRGLFLLVVAGCSGPTTALLDIRLAGGAPSPTTLKVSLFGAGRVAQATLPAKTLPGTLLVGHLDPPPHDFRVQVDGLDSDGLLLVQGASQTSLAVGEQTRVVVTLTAGSLPDRDLDGVPDVIDDCADKPDSDQLCSGADAGVPLCPSFALFCDDFESGDWMPKWHYISSGPDRFFEINGDQPHHGLFELHVGDYLSAPGGGKWLQKTLTPIKNGRLAVRSYLYLDQPLGAGFNFMALTDAGSGDGYRAAIVNKGGVANLPSVENTRAGVLHTGMNALPTKTWLCVELVIDFPASGAGQGHLYVDDQEVVAFSESTNPTNSGFSAAELGDLESSGDSEGRIFLDDVTVAPQRIGCE